MAYVGIDPGLKGGITILEEDRCKILDMPLTNNNFNYFELLQIVDSFPPASLIGLEDSEAMSFKNRDGSDRSQSVASMLSYGKHCGILFGMIYAKGHQIFLIKPRIWQALFGVKGKTKGFNSVEIALSLFPDKKEELRKPSTRSRLGYIEMDGRSDSLLIAEFIRRNSDTYFTLRAT